MSHDQNFKNLILDYPRQSLEFFAPEEAALIPPTASIVPVRQEMLQERLGETFRELDTPLLVQWEDGAREAILFILEEESDPKRFSIHRLIHYCVDLAELFETDQVVPVVIFLKPGDYQPELRLGSNHLIYLSFRFAVCDLGRIPAEHYLNSRNLVARLNLPNLRHAQEQRVEVYLRAQEGLAELESDPEKRLKYIDFIAQYANLSEAEQAQYEQHLLQSSYREAIMGPVRKAREEGLQKGLEQGLQQGLEQGLEQGLQQGVKQQMIEGIQLGLELKFGAAGLTLMPDIRKIQDIDILRNIHEGLKIVNSLADLQAIYQKPAREH